jgi:death on curing protein
MTIPVFLTVEQVLFLHADLIDRYGGSLGLRDRGLLESALAQPGAQFGGEYLHGDLFEMAAAYLFHLVMNHAFVDGNKRIGAASAIVFLSINDITIEADEDGLVELTLRVAQGLARKPEITEFFRERVIQLPEAE